MIGFSRPSRNPTGQREAVGMGKAAAAGPEPSKTSVILEPALNQSQPRLEGAEPWPAFRVAGPVGQA